MQVPSLKVMVGTGIAALLFWGNEVRRELDPYAGQWVPAIIKHCGKTEVPEPQWRLFLKISERGHATVATLWTCGMVNDWYARGKMIFSGDDILLFKENWATGEREKHANGKLLRLPNGRLGFQLHDEEEVIFVEFEREENACTFFDLLGWR